MSKTALLFAGQGAQVVGMGRDLAQSHPRARALFDRANQVLGYDLARVCFEGPEAELTRTEHAQPAIYLVGWIALELVREAVPALEFHATAGLSLGEFTALAAAGSLAFEDGLRVVRERGRLMQEACEATHGTMAAVLGLEEQGLAAVCAKTGVQIANLNCPGQIVISGPTPNVDEACLEAVKAGARKALPLPVAGAYHSSLMAGAGPGLRAVLDGGAVGESRVPVISNVTARPHDGVGSIRERLVEQVTAPVRWEASMRWLLGNGFSRFIELGPGKALSGFMKRIDRAVPVLNVGDRSSLADTVQALSTP